MSNYLARLKSKIGQICLPQQPSKPSKGGFEPFEGDRGGHISPIDGPIARTSYSAPALEISTPQEPSKPSKVPFEGFEGDLGTHISPAEVIGMMRQERARCLDETRALSVVRGNLANDPRLAPEQTDTRVCLICNGVETGRAPLLPFLSPGLGGHRWLHGGCHSEHIRRQRDKVEACLRSAGLLDVGSQGES